MHSTVRTISFYENLLPEHCMRWKVKGEQTTKGSRLPSNVLLYPPVALLPPTFNLDSFYSVSKYIVSVMPVLTIPQTPAQAANKNPTS